MLFENPYECYLYSYPHKTAYREFAEAISLTQAIDKRKRDEAHLYMHLPFCQSRCGYCNLFTTTGTFPDTYLPALRQHARAWQAAGVTKAFRFLSFAIGGGTPLLLTVEQLQELFDIAREHFFIDPARLPISIETAPRQTTLDKIAVLKANKVTRVSIGIQSFHSQELEILNRHHQPESALKALELLAQADFPVLNIDLIYGIPGQTHESFLSSLKQALLFAPQEIFLYPLYIRPHTFLDLKGAANQQNQQQTYTLYQTGRDYLIAEGYFQTSMRRFTRVPISCSTPEFSCSEENMISVGCGGRSYIGNLHFSEHYAVSQSHCQQILQDYIHRNHYAEVHYGYLLSEAELKRRFLIKNLLYYQGVDSSLYTATYGTLAEEDFPLLNTLCTEGLCTNNGRYWHLTSAGISYSDSIGAAFISEEVKQAMRQWKES